ncbi:MAG: valine--tRNA ligase [Gammaproteobacteria bacterium]|nr:valine--tRNA ligase [Gammaproteobacteria bacterium]
MEKNYSPQDIEQSSYKLWESHRYFEPQGNGKPYCVMLPPPNVTGHLHMGHGFQHTLIDIMVRYQRMMGRRTLWQPGTDHAGIATQLVVEKHLESQGLSRKTMARDEFLDRVWQWKEESGGHITAQMRRTGASPDWSRERFTLDKGLSTAVYKVFIQLHEEGLIYRGNRLVNWDPQLSTAVSDLEVISEEADGSLWHIRYPLVDSEESIIVATTRPETILGDAAVAVHPEDERYKHLIGKQVELPLCDRTIPIIADEYVDQAFGSGCVKITPAHDFNDYEIGKRHNLPQLNIFTKRATTNKNVPANYQGMDRFVARDRIIEDLKALDLLVTVESHRTKIPKGEKSGAIIEPLLTDQWYVKTEPLARPAIDAVRKGDIRFVPENWSKTYYQWMENIEDWCISRQLWWGHRIPAWYDTQGKAYVGYSENDVRFKYKLDPNLALVQDEDVLDTWFSSALWPFSSLGWPEKTVELEQFYPTTVLFTGFDIIFFWVARMIMMGLKFTGKIPFKEVVITGLVCDSEGKKMSKSKGNVLDPIDIIDGISLPDLLKKRTSNLLINSIRDKVSKQTKKAYPNGIPAYGTDALRFTFCSLASNNRQVRFDLQRVDGYRNFCNKLWNATRFVLLSTEEDNGDMDDGAFQYSPAEEWILTLLQRTIARCHEHIANYRFDLLANQLYDFVWHEYCDWYLEFSKVVLFDEEARAPVIRGTRRTLVHVLSRILKLLHPIIPFITEALWQQINKVSSDSSDTIMLCAYPHVEEQLIYPHAEEEFIWIKAMIQAIRTLRAEIGVSPAKQIPVTILHANPDTAQKLQHHQRTLMVLAKLSHIDIQDRQPESKAFASTLVGNLEIIIPMAGLIDKHAELARIDKEITKLTKDLAFAKGKLGSDNFTAKAPADVIAAMRDKLEQTELAMRKLETHRINIEEL